MLDLLNGELTANSEQDESTLLFHSSRAPQEQPAFEQVGKLDPELRRLPLILIDVGHVLKHCLVLLAPHLREDVPKQSRQLSAVIVLGNARSEARSSAPILRAVRACPMAPFFREA